MTPIELRGQVFSGKGEGARFTQLDWFQESLERLVGFRPYPGTLNLRLRDRGSIGRLAMLRDGRGLCVLPPSPAFCKALLFPAELKARGRAALIIPLVPGYPGDVLELVAAVPLRESLGLEDGAWLRIRAWAKGPLPPAEPEVGIARESPAGG
ncbi:MAG: DUF120 domain-containing protein [Nitrospinota bacterium]